MRGQALFGTAIVLDDDRVLRHIDQAPRQVPGVGRFERGVGQALAGAVRGVEVLQNGQAFFEVRDDRGLDDLAGGLGHQPAHAGQLLDLRRRAAGAGVRHHVNRVNILAGIARHGPHHLLGHPVGALRPDVDHLVVLLAAGNQAILILPFEFLDVGLGPVDQLVLGRWHDKIVLAERDSCVEGVSEAERHHPVAENDRLLLPAVAVDHVDDLGDLLLGQQAVDHAEGHRGMARQHLGQDHPPRRRIDHPGDRVAVFVHRPVARLDLGMKRQRARGQRVLDLAHVAKDLTLARLVLAIHGQIVEAKHDVLRRHDDRFAVGR